MDSHTFLNLRLNEPFDCLQVVIHYQSLSEAATITKLIAQIHKSTGEVIRKRPRCLTKQTSGLVEIEISRPICMELYKDYRELGRFMIRASGTTIAAGLVTSIMWRQLLSR